MYDERNIYDVIAAAGNNGVQGNETRAIMVWCWDRAMNRFHPAYGFEAIANSVFVMAELIYDRKITDTGIVNPATGIVDKLKLPFPNASPLFATGQAPLP